MSNRFQRLIKPTDMSGIQMFQPNIQLMGKALGAMQGRMDEADMAAEKSVDVIDVSQDIAARDRLLAQSRQDIDLVRETMKTKGLEAGMEQLSKFERDQRRLYSAGGEAYELESNYKRFIEQNKRLDDLVKKKIITQSEANASKQFGLEDFEAAGGTQSGLNRFEGVTAPEHVEMTTVVNDALKGWEANIISMHDGKSPLPFYLRNIIKKKSSKDEMRSAARQALLNANAGRYLEFQARMRGMDPDSQEAQSWIDEQIDVTVEGAVNKYAKRDIKVTDKLDYAAKAELDVDTHRRKGKIDAEIDRQSSAYIVSEGRKPVNHTGEGKAGYETVFSQAKVDLKSSMDLLHNFPEVAELVDDYKRNNGKEPSDYELLVLLEADGISSTNSAIASRAAMAQRQLRQVQNLKEVAKEAENYAIQKTGFDPDAIAQNMASEFIRNWPEGKPVELYSNQPGNEDKKVTYQPQDVEELLATSQAHFETRREKKTSAFGPTAPGAIPSDNQVMAEYTVLVMNGGSEYRVKPDNPTVSFLGYPDVLTATQGAIDGELKRKNKELEEAKEEWHKKRNQPVNQAYTPDPVYVEDAKMANSLKKETNEMMKQPSNFMAALSKALGPDSELFQYLNTNASDLKIGNTEFGTESLPMDNKGRVELPLRTSYTYTDEEGNVKTEHLHTSTKYISNTEANKAVSTMDYIDASNVAAMNRDRTNFRVSPVDGGLYARDENGVIQYGVEDFVTYQRVFSPDQDYIQRIKTENRDYERRYNQLLNTGLEMSKDDFRVHVAPLIKEADEMYRDGEVDAQGAGNHIATELKAKGFTEEQIRAVIR